jgi:hypothetical protein
VGFLFLEVRTLTVPATVWGICAIACWQAVAAIGLHLVRRAATTAAQGEPQQPITGDGPPLTATTRPVNHYPRAKNNEVPNPWQHRQQFS